MTETEWDHAYNFESKISLKLDAITSNFGSRTNLVNLLVLLKPRYLPATPESSMVPDEITWLM